MNRRSFLQRTARAALLLSLSAAFPRLAAGDDGTGVSSGMSMRPSGRLFKGTHSGLILESLDGGKTWQTVANLGDHCSILAVQQVDGGVQATVRLQSYSFTLTSPDARTWYTVDYVRPEA